MNKVAAILAEQADRIDLIRTDLAAAAATPDNAPEAPPGRFYTDPAYFDHECKTVLRQGWHCVGRTDELTGEGAFRTLNLLGEPLIIVRAPSGLKALSNVCRHRGMPVAEGEGTAKRFVCPYHAWAYDTEGDLMRAARMKNAGFDANSCKLGSFACEERYGFIYVSLADNPPDLTEALAGLTEAMSPYDPTEYRIVHSATEIWKTNWKCLVENFMEGYHLSVVHPQTLHDYTPTGLSRKGPSGAGFTSYFANYPEDIPTRGHGSEALSDEERQRSFLWSVFPCHVASIAATLLASLAITPVAVNEVEVRWTLSVYGDELDENTIAQRIALWTEVNREDREKLELMQVALNSVHATGGPLAGPDYEGTVRDFLLWLARQDNA